MRTLSRLLYEAIAVTALTAIFKLLWRGTYLLAENAIVGWADDQIASALGISSPNLAAAINLFWNWGIPVLLAILVLFIYHHVHSRWHGGSRNSWLGRTPPNVSLSDNRSEPLTGTPLSIFGLGLEFGEDGGFATITKYNLYKRTKQLNVRVNNINTTQTLRDCKVQITDIAPLSGVKLPRMLRDSFSLAAGDHAIIPLVSYGETQDPNISDYSDTLIELFGQKPISLPHDQRLTFTLRATAFDAPYSDKKCDVWIDGSKRLRIQEHAFSPISLKDATGLVWNITERAENIVFLGLSVGSHGQLQAHHFAVKGWNKTISPITSPHAYIRAENTATKYDALFNPGNAKLRPISKVETIPVGAMIDIIVPFRPDRTPIPLANFLAEFVPFTFIFESPETSSRQTITKEQIEHRIRTFQEGVNAKMITRPQIQMRRTPDGA
jgi:hypothetical protein